MFNKIKKCVFVLMAAVILAGLYSCNNVKGNAEYGFVVPLKSSVEVKKDVPDPSVKVAVNDSFVLSVGIANECVGTICWLAGFDEYQPDDENLLNAAQEYFSKYKNSKKVKKAISHYKKIRRSGFSYDAPAQFVTYITPDCHNWRTDYENVKKMAAERNQFVDFNTFGNLDKLLEVTSDFYDAVDFPSFYQGNIDQYNLLLKNVKNHSNQLKKVESYYSDYFHQQMERTVLNFSGFNVNNNYGCSFIDGEKKYFEPKYSAGVAYDFSNNLFVIVHELSHPKSNPVGDKMSRNPIISAYLDDYLTGERKETLASYAYSGNDNYMCELITRANTIRVLSKYLTEKEVYNNCIFYDIQQGFDAVTEVAEMCKEYENGDYKTFEDFEERLTELYIKKFCKTTDN